MTDSIRRVVEMCAKVCEEQESEPWYGKHGKWIDGFRDTKAICAAAIRALDVAGMEGADEDTILRAAQLLAWCAEAVQNGCKADELERFPYVPEMEAIAEQLKAAGRGNASPSGADSTEPAPAAPSHALAQERAELVAQLLELNESATPGEWKNLYQISGEADVLLANALVNALPVLISSLRGRGEVG